MQYELNDYYPLSETTDTRIEICPNKDIRTHLIAYYKQKGCPIVSVFSCIHETDVLPLPNEMISLLDKEILSYGGKRVIVNALGSYLSLLNSSNLRAFYIALRSRVDQQAMNAAYVLDADLAVIRDVFSNPKYENSLGIVYFSGDKTQEKQYDLQVTYSRWLSQGKYLRGFKKALETLDKDASPDSKIFIGVENPKTSQAGLSERISFYYDALSAARKFYDFNAPLEASIMDMVLENCASKGITPMEYLEEQFGTEYTNLRSALKRLIELPYDNFWTAYLWMVEKKFSTSSLLYKAAQKTRTKNELLKNYIVNASLEVLHSCEEDEIVKLASERASAIKEINQNLEPLISEFVKLTEKDDKAIPFLNCGTKTEHCEIIKRVSGCNLMNGIPSKYTELYPALSDYLDQFFDYGDSAINSYFFDYRRFKLNNTINESFVKRAFELNIPSTIEKRDSLLQKYISQADTALLVADALGAEYLPFLVSVATKQGLTVESAVPVLVNMPTSTEFNSINWPAERLLQETKAVDNVVHYGAEKNENTTFDDDFCEMLSKIERRIFNRLVSSLSEYKKVILTADHGASRLAVIAHNMGYAALIDCVKDPIDWRYTLEPSNSENIPDGVVVEYYAKKNRNYWVAKGYSRFPKKGAKYNELHGGSSIEEQLVPFVVFSREHVATKPNKSAIIKSKPQMVEKDDFDII